jgi:hypothetical protein
MRTVLVRVQPPQPLELESLHVLSGCFTNGGRIGHWCRCPNSVHSAPLALNEFRRQLRVALRHLQVLVPEDFRKRIELPSAHHVVARKGVAEIVKPEVRWTTACKSVILRGAETGCAMGTSVNFVVP